VRVDGVVIGRIARGLCVLVGAEIDDTTDDVAYIADKVAHLRVFADDAGHMNRALAEVDGALLVISQFTLLGDGRKGRRPSFITAMPPEPAEARYEELLTALRAHKIPVETGRFRADMQVELVNDGPVTILFDSRKIF
jgi:D-aminoacyl-tRNA deacylase